MEDLLNPIKSLVDIEMINKSLKEVDVFSDVESYSDTMPTGDTQS